MKKTFSVNIGGTVFNVDEDAYSELTEYLQNVRRHLGSQASSNEVMNDIEQRIAELLNEWMQGSRQVVTEADVKRLIETLGRPEQYEEEEAGNNSGKEEKAPGSGKEYRKSDNRDRARRRLYRDPENAILGGVCAGIAAYLNVSVVLIRLIFFILVWFGCSGLLIYFICWIIIPEAKTAAQRLEMEGEDVNIDNIEKKVREEYEKVKDRVGNYVKTNDVENKARNIGNKFADFFMEFFKILITFIAGVIALAGFLALIGIITGLVFLWTGNYHYINGWHEGWLPMQQAVVDPTNATLLTVGLLFTIGIPFVAIFNMIFGRSLNLKPTPRWAVWVAFLVWFAGVALTAFSTITWLNEFGGVWV